ncbi:MAG: DUF2330 domain-containing protein [Candidatus Eisenbacteria bacterium]|nr:DUF2330 domain-containing protein [Candidatus Eisenbacteria bacterium]
MITARCKRITAGLLAAALLLPAPAEAFCGFYVARAEADLFNESSQVVLVRDGDRTVLTMVNDYKGSLTEFALVVPVPTVLQEGQIHVANAALVDHLDAYTAPRLVEYYDGDPCALGNLPYLSERAAGMSKSDAAPARERDEALGVTVEARYTVGEYDILILSAKESGGLETWLRENEYRVPAGASRVLGAYLKQGMKFFVAKVNLKEQSALGYATLRPLQIAFEHEKFMLPIRLGMVNANGPQDLFVYALTRNGRVETTNYRTVRLPSGNEIPVYVKDEFKEFYRAMFDRQVEKENMHAVFLEYAWDMGWCDPCAADPLSNDELRELGVFWLDDGPQAPYDKRWGRRPAPPSGPPNVFVTRLHLRYDFEHFPEDLVFQETGDRENFQGRYVLRHPWTGSSDCEQAKAYRRDLAARERRQAEDLASLTGWDLELISRKMNLRWNDPASDRPSNDGGDTWWDKLWRR